MDSPRSQRYVLLSEINASSDSTLEDSYAGYVTDACKAISLKFVHDAREIDTAKPDKPEFAYQHFGEKESIFGYKDLTITLHYTDASAYFYPVVSYSSTIVAASSGLQADNIIQKLREQLPREQMNAMCSTMSVFKIRLDEQKNFKPFGELLSKFDFGPREMQVWRVDESSPSFDAYLERVQTLAFWYIEAAQYTDNSDPRWQHFFVYESIKKSDGEKRFALAGYASVVRFYNYPDMIRPRIAQILLLPQYRGSGNGVKFLQAIYSEYMKMKNVRDITVEEPTDSFQRLRDFVDCCNCSKLSEFKVDFLKKGYSNEMAKAARDKYKINPKQARRVYEILRLYHTNTRDEMEIKEYRADVKKRLEAPFRRSERDWRKLSQALKEQEFSVVTNQMNQKQKEATLEQMLEELLVTYRKVVNRLMNLSVSDVCQLSMKCS